MVSDLGKKRCSTCKDFKSVDSFFNKHRRTKDGYQNVCKPCKAVMARNWKYALKSGELDAMYARQDHKCGICKAGGVELVLDHDHKTGQVRQLLCRLCNALLGMCNDNQDVLQNAISYLQRWDGVTA